MRNLSELTFADLMREIEIRCGSLPTTLGEVSSRLAALGPHLRLVSEHCADLKRLSTLLTPTQGEAVPARILRAAADIAGRAAEDTRPRAAGTESGEIPDEAGYTPTMPRQGSATWAGIQLIYRASADGITLAAFKDALVKMGFLAGVADQLSSASSVITEMERKGWRVDRPSRGVYRFLAWPAALPRPEPRQEGIV